MRAARILFVGLVTCLVIIAARWSIHRIGPRAAVTEVVSPAAGPPSRPAPPGVVPARFIEPGDRIPEASLVDQNGRRFRLSDLRGRTIVLTFLYTHCNLPSKCPLTTLRLAEAREMVSRQGIQNVQFLIVSFDPRRDGPERLSEYAARYGLPPEDLLFATSSKEEIDRLSRPLRTFHRESSPEVIEHNIVVSIVDAQGLLREQFFGNSWSTVELVAAIRRIAGHR